MEWKEFQELVKLIIPSSYSGSISFKYEDEEIVCKIGDKNFVYSHREYNETSQGFPAIPMVQHIFIIKMK